MPLSQFRDALGRPGEGPHAHVGGVAIFDVALSIAAAHYISRYTGKPFLHVMAGVFAAGIVAHRIFGVRTAIDRLLFR